MKATIPYIEQKFEEFNRQMFGGKPDRNVDGQTSIAFILLVF